MRKMIYVVKETGYETSDYNLIKNLPEHAYSIKFEEVKPEENEKDKKTRLERIQKRQKALANHKTA